MRGPGLLLALIGAASALGAQSALAGRWDPMQFTLQPPDPRCPDCEVILAQGLIDIDSTERLATLLATLDPARSVTIEFDSPGGLIAGGMDLGRLIRQRQLATSITFYVGDEPSVAFSECMSSCAYAFLGGVERTVWSDAKFGIHSGKIDIGPDADPQLRRFTTTLEHWGRHDLELYLAELGMAADLLVLADTVPPNEIRLLTRPELEAYGVVTTSEAAPPDPWLP